MSTITRSPYTYPVGSKVRFSQCGTIAEVTGHTERGFTYRGGPVLSIPRLGVKGTGEGEVFTDVPGWDTYVIAYKPEVTARRMCIDCSRDFTPDEPHHNTCAECAKYKAWSEL